MASSLMLLCNRNNNNNNNNRTIAVMGLVLILLLFFTTTASSSADDGQHKVVISDDTELNDDIGGNTVTPDVPIREPPVEQIRNGGHIEAEISKEISDETEIEAEPEEQRKEQPSSESTTANPLEQMRVRRQQLEETLVHVRNRFLKRRSLVSSQDVQASPEEVHGNQQITDDEREADDDSEVTDSPATVSIHLTIKKDPSKKSLDSESKVGMQTISSDSALGDVEDRKLRESIKGKSMAAKDMQSVNSAFGDRQAQETDDVDENDDDEGNDDDDDDEFYEEEEEEDDFVDESEETVSSYETDVASDRNNAQYFELYEDFEVTRDNRLTVNPEISLASNLSSLHDVSDDSQKKQNDSDKLGKETNSSALFTIDDIGFPGSVVEDNQPSEEITMPPVEKEQEQTVTHSSVGSETVEEPTAGVQSHSVSTEQQQLHVSEVVANDDTETTDRVAEIADNSEKLKDSSEVEDLLTSNVKETVIDTNQNVDETEVEEKSDENNENQQKTDHNEEVVAEDIEGGKSPFPDTVGTVEEHDEIKSEEMFDESVGKDFKNQEVHDESESESVGKKEISAESQSDNKDIKEVVNNELEGVSLQEVSDEISKSERTESTEIPAIVSSEKMEEDKQDDLDKVQVNAIGNKEEFNLEGDAKLQEGVSVSIVIAKDDVEPTRDTTESESNILSDLDKDAVIDNESDFKKSSKEVPPESDVDIASSRTEDLPHSERHAEKDFMENTTQSDASVSETDSEPVESRTSDSLVEGNQGSSISEDDNQQRDRAWHSSSGGLGLRSLLSDNEVDSNLVKIPVNENVELPDDKVKYSSSDADDSLKSEEEKDGEPKNEEFSEFQHQYESPDRPTASVFTMKPYLVISENVLSGLDPYLEDIISAMPSDFQKLFLNAPFAFTPPRNLLLFAGSCLSLLIILSCGCLASSKQRSQQSERKGLLQKLSSVQEALLISEQEKETVAGELESLKKQSQDFKIQSTTTSEQAEKLTGLISDLTKENETLQEQLSQQLSHKTDLSAKISSQSDSIKKLSEKNKALQKKLEETTSHKDLLETQLHEIQTTLQKSQSSALEMQSQLQSMTEEIAILQTSKDQLLLEAEGWNEKVQEQEDQISKLLEQEKTLVESNSLKEKELSVLRDCYQQLKLFENSLDYIDSSNGEVDGEEDEEVKRKRLQDEVQMKIKSMIDVAQINAKLNASEEEKSSLKNALTIEMESRMELEDQIKQMKTDMEKLMESRQEAEQQASTTAIKMDVLVNYFKEKETELTRKLGEQEAREKASADQLVSTDEKTKEFERMVHLYKEQVEDLQKEIQSIEADYRKQIALQEKKAHENWLVARQSERDVKEYKTEAQILRLKILELQNRLDAITAESKGTQESGQTISGIANGAISMLPNEDRPTSRPLLQNPAFGLPPPFPPGPFLPSDRPLPPPLFGHPLPPPPPPPMMFDRRQPEMRSPPPFDMWHPPPHLRRSPAPPRDRSPPRGRSPSPLRRGASPESQRSRHSPSSLRAGRYSPPHSRNRSPPPGIGDRQSPYIHGPRIPPSGTARPARPPYNRTGHDSRPAP